MDPLQGKPRFSENYRNWATLLNPETARDFINGEINREKSIKEIRSNEAEFQRKVLEMKIKVEKRAPKERSSSIF